MFSSGKRWEGLSSKDPPIFKFPSPLNHWIVGAILKGLQDPLKSPLKHDRQEAGAELGLVCVEEDVERHIGANFNVVRQVILETEDRDRDVAEVAAVKVDHSTRPGAEEDAPAGMVLKGQIVTETAAEMDAVDCSQSPIETEAGADMVGEKILRFQGNVEGGIQPVRPHKDAHAHSQLKLTPFGGGLGGLNR